MDTHDMMIELLAIKLHEHTPLASGARQMVDWTKLSSEDRQNYRDLILGHHTAEGLIDELTEEP
jgi:hypothetical protein